MAGPYEFTSELKELMITGSLQVEPEFDELENFI